VLAEVVLFPYANCEIVDWKDVFALVGSSLADWLSFLDNGVDFDPDPPIMD